MNTYYVTDININSVKQTWRAFLTSAEDLCSIMVILVSILEGKVSGHLHIYCNKPCKTDKGHAGFNHLEVPVPLISRRQTHVSPAQPGSVHEGQHDEQRRKGRAI